MSKVRELLSSTEAPFSWVLCLSVTVIFGGAVALATAVHISPPMVAILPAIFMTIFATMGPFFMVLRLQIMVGVAIVLAFLLGHLTPDMPFIAALMMAVVIWFVTLLMGVPVIGQALGAIPIVAYFLAAEVGITKGYSAVQVVLWAIAGTVVGMAFGLATLARDPHKKARAAVANSWRFETPDSKRGGALRVLYLDGNARELVSLVVSSGLASLGARGLQTAQSMDAREFLAKAQTQAASIGRALIPAGPAVPREVPEWASDASAAIGGIDQRERQSLQLCDRALAYATALMRGETSPKTATTEGIPLARSVVLAVTQPDIALVRYALRKAIVVAVLTFIVVLTNYNENAIWIAMTALVAMVPMGATEKALQRSLGGLIGGLLAAGLSLFVPTNILFPFVTAIAMGISFGFFYRNYAVFTGGIGFLVATSVGVAKHDVALWAGARVLDVVIGCAVAVAATAFLLPRTARPGVRIRKSVAALDVMTDLLRDGIAPSPLDRQAVRRANEIAAARITELASEQDAAPREIDERYAQAVQTLQSGHDDLRLLAVLVITDPAAPGLAEALEMSRQRYHDGPGVVELRSQGL